MKTPFKHLPVSAALILSLGVPFAIAEDTATSDSDRNKVKNGNVNDKPDAYTVEDSKEKGLTNAKKPVRKLDHKQKSKGDMPMDSSTRTHETSGASETGNADTSTAK